MAANQSSVINNGVIGVISWQRKWRNRKRNQRKRKAQAYAHGHENNNAVASVSIKWRSESGISSGSVS